MGKLKLKYDFDTSKCLEVEYEPGAWNRVTCNTFRSYNGNRRIITWDKNKNPIYTEFNHPLYYFETNTIVETPINDGTQYIHGKRTESQPRKYENFS
jgi:hypothetical protein